MEQIEANGEKIVDIQISIFTLLKNSETLHLLKNKSLYFETIKNFQNGVN